MISVILATRNRASILRDTLESFRALDPPGCGWELIVGDNGSTDATQDLLSEMENCLPLTHFVEQTPGKNRCLNRAIDLAQGSLFLFTDDDVIADRRWLQEMEAVAARWPQHSIFGGKITARFPPGTPSWLPKVNWVGVFATYSPAPGEGVVSVAPNGPNLMVRRSALGATRYDESIGPAGANYAMGSETELMNRLASEGHAFVYAPHAIVEHVIRPEQVTHRWLRGRARRHGRGVARLTGPFHGPVLLGAPRYLWRRLATDAVKIASTLVRPAPRRLEAQRKFYFTLGMIQEYRFMRTRSPRNAAPSRASGPRLAAPSCKTAE